MSPELQIVQGDILDLAKLAETLATQAVDRIVHLAAFLPEAAIREDPTTAIKYNGEGTNAGYAQSHGVGGGLPELRLDRHAGGLRAGRW